MRSPSASARRSNGALWVGGGLVAGAGVTYGIHKTFGVGAIKAGIGTGVVALGASALVSEGDLKSGLRAAAVGAVAMAGVQTIAYHFGAKAAQKQQQQQQQPQHATEAPKDEKGKRQADSDGSGYVKREEFDALAARIDRFTVEQKQATCDLLTALRGELQRVATSAQPAANESSTVAPSDNRVPSMNDARAPSVNDNRPAAPSDRARQFVAPTRSAAVDERDAGDSDYMSSAYGRNASDERDAYAADEYQTSAYGSRNDERDSDERDAPDERDSDERDSDECDAPDERDSDERDAPDERDSDERDSIDERDAPDERDSDERDAPVLYESTA